MPELLLFALVLAAGQFSPGPDMLLLTHTSLRHGKRAGWWMAAGITTGLAVHASVAVGGLHLITGIFPAFWIILPWIAAVYLSYLAVLLWRSASESIQSTPEVHPEAAGPAKMRGFYLRGLACNLLNPKAMIFFAALVTTFLGGNPEPGRAVALGVIIVVEGLVLWGLWVALLQHRVARTIYQRGGRIINRTFSMLLLLLAGKLLWSALSTGATTPS